MSELVLYATRDDEREARELAEQLNDRGRRAVVERVQEMAQRNDPLTPRTADRWAVIAEKKR